MELGVYVSKCGRHIVTYERESNIMFICRHTKHPPILRLFELTENYIYLGEL